MTELAGHIVTAKGVVEGCLQFNESIVSINEIASSDQRIILPGIIDCHIHGGGGGDVMEGLSGIRSLGRTHAQFGLTGFLATTVTADNASIEQVWLFLTEECGELAGFIRRSQNHFRDDRKIKLEDELGDVFSYLFQISGMLNIDLNVMWSKNIQKVHQKIYN